MAQEQRQQEMPLKEHHDSKTVGILRLDSRKLRRSSAASSFSSVMLTPPKMETFSPQPSVDRLSVTFAPGSFLSRQGMEKVHFNKDHKANTDGEDGDEDAEEEEEDYSASVSAILLRRASSKRQTSKRRRASSTFSPDDLDARRRSSNLTTTSADTAISIDEGMTEEHIFQNIKLHKEVLSNVKQQPWPMRRKMKLVKQAKNYVKIHEGELQERLAQSKTTRDMLACCDIIFVKEWQFVKRELANLMNVMVPWELRIKEIESHFGSVVASYFTFLRWLFWVNLVIALILLTFVAIPEVLTADRHNAGERKEVLDDEKANATNFMTLWDFEGVLKYSPIFYGYYSSQEKSNRGFGYKGPLAYFLTGLAVYIYSFVATLRRMAENSRQSKLSEKDDECVFTWKLFTGWDYMIGNSETAHNRTASIILGFKEALLEEAEKKRDERSWKMLALRIFTNLNVLWLFASSVYAVVLVVERSTKQREAGGWWKQNEVTIVVSLITNVFPFIFEMLGSLEQYHPRKRLRMQLARIMVLNMLNLYTFILASFSKISDMTIRLQEIKKTLINASSSQPAELMLGKHEMLTPVATTINSNILYNIFNLSQSTTVSRCYTKKVNCTTTMTTDQSFSSSFSSPSSTTPSTFSSPSSSSSSMSTLTTLFLLSTTLSSLTSDIERNTSNFFNNNNSDIYDFNNYTENEIKPRSIIDYNNYNSIYEMDMKNQTNNTINFKRNIAKDGTKHYIVPLNFKLNFNKNRSEISDEDEDNNEEDFENYLTPEDYPDNNYTDLYIPEGNLSSTTLEDNYTTESTTTEYFVTDDGCVTITVCPDMSSTVTGSSSQSLSGSSSTYFSETTTEFKTLATSSSPVNVPELALPRDLSLQTKNLDMETRRKLRSLCWETMFGQELVKLTVMDLVLTVISTFVVDFFRAVFVRIMNNCWCWDLEKKFPQYGDFKIAENILHLVNNQGMVWMGMFFSPGLPLINLIKLIIMMYLRSWAVLTCNVPHEVVFRASRSNNFYLALLLTMLFLCVLPVSYAIVWVEPSWHCGPFSNYEKIYHLFTNSTKKALPSKTIHRALDYIASPGIIIPLLMLLILIIYYLISLTNALREANNDLKIQLRRERTEERRKVFQMVDRKHRGGGSGDLIDSTPFQKWPKSLHVLPNSKTGDQTSDDHKGDKDHNINGDIKTDAKKLLSKLTKHTTHKHSDEECIPIVDADATDIDQTESLPDDRITLHHHLHKQKISTTAVEVHKTEAHSKKHHDEIDVTHHKHDKHTAHDKHDKSSEHKTEKHEKPEKDKHDKHDKIEKHDKGLKKHKGLPKFHRKDSVASVRSENIPEILISQTDSPGDSQEDTEDNFDQPSKSSSADTIIATEMVDHHGHTDEKNKKQKLHKLTKQTAEHDIDIEKYKQIKIDQRDELHKPNKKQVAVESKHHDKIKLEEEESPKDHHKRKTEDKHHTEKEKHTILDKIPKIKIKSHKVKDEKSDETGSKKRHDDTSPHKDKKTESENFHKEKERKKDSHDKHHEDDKDKKHHVHSGDTEKKLKIKPKVKGENVYKSDESEEEKPTIKKKKHLSDETKSHQFTSESSSKEETSFKIQPRNKLHVDDSPHVSSTYSTDESSKSSKRSRTDKSTTSETSDKQDDKNMHRYKEKHKDKIRSVNKLDETDVDHKHLRHKRKDNEQTHDKIKEHKPVQGKDTSVKKITPQESSEDEKEHSKQKPSTDKLEMSKKVTQSKKHTPSDQSEVCEDEFDKKHSKRKDKDHKHLEKEIETDDSATGHKSDSDLNDDNKTIKSDKHKLPTKSKKVILIECEKQQSSSSDSQSLQSQLSQESQSIKAADDDDDNDEEDGDDDRTETDDSSKDHSNESVKERSM